MDISNLPNYPCDVFNCRVPFNKFEENNALLLREVFNKKRMLHQQKKKNKQRLSKICSRGHWKPSEDSKLRELVDVYGPQNWNHIAEKMQGRTGKSCRLRWFNQLDPRINKTAFTNEDEEKLLEAHRKFGNKWSFISKLFNGRTDNAVKNHWHVLMARKLRSHSMKKGANKPIASEDNLQTFNLFPGSVSDESRELNKYSWEMLKEETCNLKVQYCSSRMPMPYSGHHHHQFSTFPGDSLAPSPSSSSSSLLSSSEAGNTFMGRCSETNIPPRFIDFLGVGNS